MSDAFQAYYDQQATVSENTFRMYGYAQGRIRSLADGLRFGSIDRNEAAQRLLALDKTMQRLFEERDEKGAYDRIGENFDKFLYEERADALCKLEAENQA